MSEPNLHIRPPAGEVTAVALVLHGGRENGTGPVPPWALAYLRMRPFADALVKAGGRSGLAVASLRYLVRGWNGDLQSPVPDARWALEQLRERFGEVEVGLVGHSMGGRTAIAVADDPSVRVVTALAPWIEPGDSPEPLTDRTALFMHGSADRVTSPVNSRAFAAQARAIAKQVTYVAVANDKHAMLHRARLWHEAAAAFTVEVLLNPAPAGSISADAAAVVRQAVAGVATVEI
jgi:hypothetical protein